MTQTAKWTRTTKIVAIIETLWLIAVSLFTVFVMTHMSTRLGSFSATTGIISCTDSFSCLHEKGHALDKSFGWPSYSTEWKNAVNIYRNVQWKLEPEQRDSMSGMIEFFPGIGSPYQPDYDIRDYSFWHGGWGGYSELYAMVYAYAWGNVDAIPNILRPFFQHSTYIYLVETSHD